MKATGLFEYQREREGQSQKQACPLVPVCPGLPRNQSVAPASHPPHMKFSRTSCLVPRVLQGEDMLFVKKSRRRSLSLVMLGTGGNMWCRGGKGQDGVRGWMRWLIVASATSRWGRAVSTHSALNIIPRVRAHVCAPTPKSKFSG